MDIIFGQNNLVIGQNGDISPQESDSSTSYMTTGTANEYFKMRLNSQVWFASEPSDQMAALATATRYIDRLNFIGSKTDDTQEHQFPRSGDTVVPKDIQYACCEIAIALLDGVDIERERENLDMTQQSYGSTKSTYDRATRPAHILAGIPSIVAWNYLLPYLPDMRLVAVTRV
jgi:hypothetical protein